MEELLNKYLPGAMLFLFVLCLLWVRKVNPSNKSTTTYIATKDLFRKETCPYCKCKMKKTWKEEPFDPMGIGGERIREFNASPIFTCKKCGYKKEG